MLTLHLAASLILLVGGDTDNSTINLPATDIRDKLVKGLTAAQIKPLLEGVGRDRAEGLADLHGDADADELLEARDVGRQVGVQVVRVERRPELRVLGGLEQGRQSGELLHGLDEVRGLRCGLGLACGGEGLRVGGEQGEAQREGRGGEHGQSLGQDVGHRLGLEEVRIELVAFEGESVSNHIERLGFRVWEGRFWVLQCQPGIVPFQKVQNSQHPHRNGLSGNRKRVLKKVVHHRKDTRTKKEQSRIKN